MTLHGVALLPHRQVPSSMAMAASFLIVGSSAWVWEPSAWRDRGDQLLDRARRLGLKRLYVTIGISDGVILHHPTLEEFLAAAERHQIAIEAVEGDPHMTSGRGLALALERAKALRALLRSGYGCCLGGVQYDIEPYARRGWNGDAADFAQWSKAIARLAEALGEPVDIAVPFWLLGYAHGEAMLDELRSALRLITVMAYRTAEAELFEIAQLRDRWASQAVIPWQMALEAGPGDAMMSFQGDLDRGSTTVAAVFARQPLMRCPGFAIHGLQL